MRRHFVNTRWRKRINTEVSWGDLAVKLAVIGVTLDPGPARPSGVRFAHCIFHDERSPSLKLDPRGLCFCFGCGDGGTILSVATRFFELHTLRDVKAFFGLDAVQERPFPARQFRYTEDIRQALKERQAAQSSLLASVAKPQARLQPQNPHQLRLI